MKTLVVLALVGLLSGCAGTATYDVHPFFDSASQSVICCEAKVRSSKNVGSVTVHFAKTGDTYVVDLSETDVSASVPITAQSSAVKSVSDAISNTAITAAKFIP